MWRTFLSISTSLSIATGGLLLLSTPVAPQALSASDAQRVATPFALSATGYGTHEIGGRLPASSDPVANEGIGCTNTAGVEAENHAAQSAVPGLGTLSGVTTRVHTAHEP